MVYNHISGPDKKGGGNVGTGFVSALFILGIILLILEIFVPGGILGLFGTIALITGIMLTTNSLAQGIFYISLLLLTLAGLFALSFRLQTRFIQENFALKTCQSQKDGYVSPNRSYEAFLDKQGIALCQLRPAGMADFSGERIDVVTEGAFVISGSRIKVIGVEGTRVIVRQTKA